MPVRRRGRRGRTRRTGEEMKPFTITAVPRPDRPGYSEVLISGQPVMCSDDPHRDGCLFLIECDYDPKTPVALCHYGRADATQATLGGVVNRK
jgi:hypothetical protein